VLKYVLIIDAHNVGIIPENILLKKSIFLYRYIIRHTDLTLVSNKNLLRIVRRRGGTAIVLPDKIPNPPAKFSPNKNGSTYKIVSINTFADDEPFQVIIEAAKRLPANMLLYMTGNHQRIQGSLINEQQYIKFTGFLSERDYWSLIASADLVVDLTYRNDCLLCGAYEAVAMETPLILSDTQALRSYFYKGAVYTQNSAKNVACSIAAGIKNLRKLRKHVISLKNELSIAWESQGKLLTAFIDDALRSNQQERKNTHKSIGGHSQ
jgi:glycosyltransferase involved in cell wall biosynthesis